ncbi:hypothetical protein STVA_45170 [Allostella vacuolata]|nr:hypothetical protein STVA_45170 [Stella vacuolata]
MRFETKIAVVIRDELDVWQKLNVAAFLSGGLVGLHPELPGEPYVDADGQRYGPLVRQPILVFAATGAELARTLRRSRGRGLVPSIYTRELFSTSHDAANRGAVAAVPTDALDLVGLALHGDRKAVDKVIDGLRLHP